MASHPLVMRSRLKWKLSKCSQIQLFCFFKSIEFGEQSVIYCVDDYKKHAKLSV